MTSVHIGDTPTRTKPLARRTLRVRVVQLVCKNTGSYCAGEVLGVRSRHRCEAEGLLPTSVIAWLLWVPKWHSNPIGDRVRQRLPSSLLIENVSAVSFMASPRQSHAETFPIKASDKPVKTFGHNRKCPFSGPISIAGWKGCSPSYRPGLPISGASTTSFIRPRA